ncbi:MAG TPA: hypothetical protein VL651_10140 [Bacteroidia bacterium]|jgi:hypothetical protein|nr:hypothetical protein [Bacteroidia bacterium]
MKPLYAIALVCGLTLGLVACGPSEAERKADSLEVDSTHKEMNATGDHLIDSMNAAMAAMNNNDTSKKDTAHKK